MTMKNERRVNSSAAWIATTVAVLVTVSGWAFGLGLAQERLKSLSDRLENHQLAPAHESTVKALSEISLELAVNREKQENTAQEITRLRELLEVINRRMIATNRN